MLLPYYRFRELWNNHAMPQNFAISTLTYTSGQISQTIKESMNPC